MSRRHAIPSQVGHTALVTGGNAGLGLAIATALAASGAKVLLACRNLGKAEAAAARVRAVSSAPVEVVPLDLASLASIAAAAAQILDGEERLDLLINNAGLMAVDEGRTEDGSETQVGVNHLGHFALTGRLLPLLLATPGSRVVTMSSMAARGGNVDLTDLHFERRPYKRWVAYNQSKLANLLFAFELQRRLAASGARTASLAAHPGATRTDLGAEGTGISNRLTRPLLKLSQSADAGAQPLLRAATDPGAIGGQCYGPRFRVFGSAALETPLATALEPWLADALWSRSEELTDVSFRLERAVDR